MRKLISSFMIVTGITALTPWLSSGNGAGDNFDHPGRMWQSAQAASPVPPSADDTAGVTDKEVLIASCCALEGPVASLGKKVVAGASTYLNYINEQGGVNGRKIKLVTHNDGYDPDKAIQCFNAMLSEKAFAGAFFVGAPPATKYMFLSKSHKVPIVGLYTGLPTLYESFQPYMFCIRASYGDESKAQVDNLWKLGYRKFAVIYQDDACGVGTLNGVRQALKAHNATTVAAGSFARGSLNIDDTVKQVKEHNPEVVIMDGVYEPLLKIIQKSHQEGFKPLFVSVSFVATEPFIKAGGKDVEGTVITQVVPPYSRDNLSTIALYKKLFAKYYPKEQPSFASLEGFVDAIVLVEGLKRAGKDLTRSKLMTALESMHEFDLGLGNQFKLTFGQKKHCGLNSVCYTVVHNGQPVPFIDWNQLKTLSGLKLPSEK